MLPEFSGAFPQPTFQPWLMLLVAAILTTGRRTIMNLLRTVGILALAIRPPMRHVERFSPRLLSLALLRDSQGDIPRELFRERDRPGQTAELMARGLLIDPQLGRGPWPTSATQRPPCPARACPAHRCRAVRVARNMMVFIRPSSSP